MLEFLSKTPVQIALAALGTAAVATGSYMIGYRNGAKDGAQAVFEHVSSLILDKTEDPDYQTTN